MYVTDTHSFIWFLEGDKKLGKKALAVFQACDEGKEIIVIPSIVLLECMFVYEKKRIEAEFQEITRKLEGSLNYQVYPLDEDIVHLCQNLNQVIEMHDRIITATARLLNAPLLTKDENIVKSKIVNTVW
jgi:PIN domain nuclease of toxin-antitoxin system